MEMARLQACHSLSIQRSSYPARSANVKVRRDQTNYGASQSRSGFASCRALLYAMSKVRHVEAR